MQHADDGLDTSAVIPMSERQQNNLNSFEKNAENFLGRKAGLAMTATAKSFDCIDDDAIFSARPSNAGSKPFFLSCLRCHAFIEFLLFQLVSHHQTSMLMFPSTEVYDLLNNLHTFLAAMDSTASELTGHFDGMKNLCNVCRLFPIENQNSSSCEHTKWRLDFNYVTHTRRKQVPLQTTHELCSSFAMI